MFFDMNYIFWVLIPTVLISGAAQLYVRSAYSKWGNTRNGSNLNGELVARRIMNTAGLNHVGLRRVPGDLSDHYDPRDNTVGMSAGVSDQPSIAAMAIVAHELGHAQQYQEQSPMIAVRSFLLPAVQISPMVSYGLILAGLLMGLSGLAWLGIAFFAVSVVFMLLTLPVEIDASRRGLALLEASGLMVTEQDRAGARAMLTAAAFTYIAAAVTAILTLVYYISLVAGNRD